MASLYIKVGNSMKQIAKYTIWLDAPYWREIGADGIEDYWDSITYEIMAFGITRDSIIVERFIEPSTLDTTTIIVYEDE
jgi:hypothetical protein